MVRFLLYFIAANIIGIGFFWLSARTLPFSEVGNYLNHANLSTIGLWAGIFVLVYGLCHGARVVRWYALVKPLGSDISAPMVHRVSALGFAAIMLLPLRLGEFVRPYAMSRRSQLPMTSLLGTVVVERVLDGLFITGLLFLTLATYSGTRLTGFALTSGILGAAVFLPASLVCAFSLWHREAVQRVIRRCLDWVSPRLAAKICTILDSFVEGFRGLLQTQAMGRFVFWSAVYWGANVVSMWLLARFGFGLEIGAWEMTTVLAILVIGLMIPSGPALAGNFEYFMAQGMALFIVIEITELGASVAVFAGLVHLLQFFVIVIPGFVIMWGDRDLRALIRLSHDARQEAMTSRN